MAQPKQWNSDCDEDEQEDVDTHTTGSRKVKVKVYKETQWGTDSSTKRSERGTLSGQWISKNRTPKSTSRKLSTGACRVAGVGAGVLADKVLLHYGIGVATEAEVNAQKAECDVCVSEAAGLKFLNAGADAKTGTAAAGCSATPVQAEAFSKASGAEASARAGLIESVVEASARAVAGEAHARAGIGMKDLGAHAEVSASVAKVEAGLTNVPFAQVGASGPEAKAEGGVSWKYTGASAGAYAGEARAGPFAARAGVKFGAGFRNGVPEVDLGPVTVPACSVM